VLRSERSRSEIGLHDAFRMRIADVTEFTEKPMVYDLGFKLTISGAVQEKIRTEPNQNRSISLTVSQPNQNLRTSRSRVQARWAGSGKLLGRAGACLPSVDH
jgi:hypothetical protein